MTRLVVLGSSLTALAVVRDAHEHGLDSCLVDTEPGIAFRSRWSEPKLAPGASDPALVALLEALARGGDACVIATGDRWVRFLMQHRRVMDAAFAKVLHPTNAALEVCLGKVRFAEWCRTNALPAPMFWVPGEVDFPSGFPYPVLVRPSATQHDVSRRGVPKAAEAGTPEQLRALLDLYRQRGVQPLVTESLLRRRLTQYSVPFARAGERALSFVARKVRPLPERCAVGTCVELWPNPEVQALALRAVERLDYYGIGEVEVLHEDDTGRNHLIEINARPWLQYAMAPASGHDFLGLLLGVPAAKPKPVVVSGKTWIDLRSDLYAAFSRSEGAVTTGSMSLIAYLRSLLRVNVPARLQLLDPAPALPDVAKRFRH